jgi:iron complex transport system permease protein
MSSRATHLTRERFARVLLTLAGVLAAAVLGSALVGSEPIDLGRALFGAAAGNVDAVILFRIRLPRALLGVVVGGALAAAGTVLQALLRNPLADPYVLGTSGGAAVGALLALMFGLAMSREKMYRRIEERIGIGRRRGKCRVDVGIYAPS